MIYKHELRPVVLSLLEDHLEIKAEKKEDRVIIRLVLKDDTGRTTLSKCEVKL